MVISFVKSIFFLFSNKLFALFLSVGH